MSTEKIILNSEEKIRMRRDESSKFGTKQITITAVLLAICIVSQVFKNIHVLITGPIVNLCIVLAVLMVNLPCGIILSIITPNILLCYCNEAECYLLLDKLASVKNCLLAIKRLEADPRVKSEYFHDILVLDVRMRGNYVLGNMEEYAKYSDMLLKTIQTEFFSVDNIDDIYGACRFLMKIGRVDEVADIVKNVERTINDINIAYLRKQYAKIKCELYTLLNDDEKKYLRIIGKL